MKNYRYIKLALIFYFSIFMTPSYSKELSTPAQKELMAKEYAVVSKMRHKLKELLERQKFEEVLQEGNDAYSSFQNLEKWLQNLESQKGDKALEEFMEALKDFENHLSSVLEQQNEVAQQYPSMLPQNNQMQQVPLSDVMEAIKELVKQGKIDEARELLNQLFAAFDNQQQQMQQGISQMNAEKFRETQQNLSRMNHLLNQALQEERQVRQLLQQMSAMQSQPNNMRANSFSKQNKVTNLTQQMQQDMENMIYSPLLNLDGLSGTMEDAQEASRQTEQMIGEGNDGQAREQAMYTQTLLQKMQQQIGQAQQQIQQLTQRMGQRRGRNQRGFGSEKGVRPPKFEYEFQVDPNFRQAIQEFNQKEHPTITPEQRQYLQDVIK